MTGTTTSAPTTVPTRVLVFGMGRSDGTVHASDVYPVAEACGQSREQVRSCLRRLVADGTFTREGDGREAVYTATERGRAIWLAALERHRLAYTQDRLGRGWDRRWRLVGFAVPEARRPARDRLRDRLLDLGGAPLQSGLYVSPNPWHDDAREAAAHQGLAEAVTLATTDDLEVGGERDPRALAERLWDLGAVAARYEDFLDRYRDVPAGLAEMRERKERLSDADFLAGALTVIVDFETCFRHDPLLPPELLPRPWPGRAARELLADVRRVGVLSRQQHDRPVLFQELDQVLDEL